MSDVEITIRMARPEDAGDLLGLLKKLQSESKNFITDTDVEHVNKGYEADQIGMINQSGTSIILVACADDNLTGLVTVSGRKGQMGEVGIAVLQSFQRIGLGTVLLNEAINWTNNHSLLTGLWLEVLRSNEEAIRLYQKNGFEKVSENDEQLKMEYKKSDEN